MQEYLNENTLFSTVMMLRQPKDKLILVVEGVYDQKALKDHHSKDLTLVQGEGGKQNVLKAARLAVKNGLKRVRFLVDRDYDDFGQDHSASNANVFKTDGHDSFIDFLMADKKQLYRVIDGYSVPATQRPGAKNRPARSPEEVLDDAIDLASSLAAVRIVDARRDLGLNFRTFKFGGVPKLRNDSRKVAEIVLSKSGYEGEARTEILDEAADAQQMLREQAKPLIGDHDLFEALARVLKDEGVSIKVQTLHTSFMLLVTCSAISGTAWYQGIQEWCASFGLAGFTCEAGVKV